MGPTAGVFALLLPYGIAALSAIVLLAAIRGSMRRFMALHRRTSSVPPEASRRAYAPPLHFEVAAGVDQPHSDDGRELMTRATNARHTVEILYCNAGLACAAVLALQPTAQYPFMLLLLVQAWPVVMTVVGVSTLPYRRQVIVLCVAGAILGLISHAFAGTPALWLTVNGPPTLLLLATTNRKLKTIAPVMAVLVFVAVMTMNGGLSLITGLASWHPLAVALLGVALAAFSTLAGMAAVVLLAFAYSRKIFSERAFQQAFLWCTFCAWGAIVNPAHSAYPISGLALYFFLVALEMPAVRRYVHQRNAASLLVLRAFNAPDHAQTLFDELGAHWRSVGPPHLVAGTDSAVANLDLDEAVRYLTRRFRSLFVADEADLDRRIERLDMKPDPDGRYRTNDFFCYADTWKPTFRRLLDHAHACLVDLRGYGQRNEGVAFELEHLIARRPLDSFVLVVDETTDMVCMRKTITAIWSRIDPSAPNACVKDPVIRLLRKPSARQLVAALCDAAVAGGWTSTIPECSNTSTSSATSSTGARPSPTAPVPAR